MTLSFTTSKRLWLFQETVTTLSGMLKDLHLIRRILLVDQGSRPEDVEEMSRMLVASFPDRELSILTRPSPAGHACSMRVWYESVKTNYVFHCEDDWRFIIPGTPLSSALDILQSDSRLGQVAVVKVPTKGCQAAETPSGTKYWRYVYNGDSCYRSNVDGSWPHFTLTPSIIKFEAIRKVGNFPDPPHFEHTYARRWVAAGYQTAFLTQNFAIHIGDKNSAYDINQTRR